MKILPKKTFDAGKTPEMGFTAVEPKPLSKADISSLEKEMAELFTVKDNVKDLKAQIVRLRAGPTPETVRKAISFRDDEWLFAIQSMQLAVVYNDVKGRMKTLELVTRQGKNEVRVTDFLSISPRRVV